MIRAVGGRSGLGAVLMACQIGCGGAAVEQVPNTSRAATKWTRQDSPERVCLEYSTAVAETGKNKLGFEVPATLPSGTTISPKLSVERETNIAQIYTVSETLQLGHAALYRLCEARGNEDIESKDYKEMFSSVFEEVKELIQVQVDVRHHKIVLQRVAVAEELELLDRQTYLLGEQYRNDLDRIRCASQTGVATIDALVKQLAPYPDRRSVATLEELAKGLEAVDATKFSREQREQEAKKRDCVGAVRTTNKTLADYFVKEFERSQKDSKLRGIDSALQYLFLDKDPPGTQAADPPPRATTTTSPSAPATPATPPSPGAAAPASSGSSAAAPAPN